MVRTLKYLRGEMCLCCGAGEAVGHQEEERYMGGGNAKLQSEFRKIGVVNSLGFTTRGLEGGWAR